MLDSVNLKDNCSKEHAKGDCEDINCKKSKCTKRHRRLCRYENKCFHFCRNFCEFKHNSDNSSLLEKKLQKFQVEVDHNQDKCEKLKASAKKIDMLKPQSKLSIPAWKRRKRKLSI